MLGASIKRYRIAKNITQKELAQAVGIDYTVISRYENGTVQPPLDRLDAIAKVLDVDVNVLLGTSAVNTEATEPDSYTYSIDADKMVTKASWEYELLRKIHMCELCGYSDDEIDPTAFFEIHFVKWLSEGGKPALSNTVVLCPNCHKRIHIMNDQTVKQLKEIALTHK